MKTLRAASLLCMFGLSLVLVPRTHGQTYTFTTFAGVAGQSGSSDHTATTARFNQPGAVATDSAGNIYIADTFNSTIRKLTPTGAVTTLAGVAGSPGSADGAGAAARFAAPLGIATDRAGNIFVADTDNHTIRKIAPDGTVSTLAGLAGNSGSANGQGGGARFSFPKGLAADSAGNLFVADSGSATIRKLTPDGTVTTFAGTTPDIFGFDRDADGTGAAAHFLRPYGIAVDAAGNVFVSDSTSQTIRKITAAGVVTTLAGTTTVFGPIPLIGDRPIALNTSGAIDGQGAAARFNKPANLTLDPAGNLYVIDSGNSTVRKITPAGAVTTLAGSAPLNGSNDGLGSFAKFWFPTGLALESGGNLIVADTQNNTLRRVTPAGTVTTIAGAPPVVSVANGFVEFIVNTRGSTDSAGGTALFFAPFGIAIDDAGNLYISDSANATIRKITLAGAVTTLAGSPRSLGATDGIGDAARFFRPEGVAVDADGTVFVADAHASTIRKISPAGVVTTLAGLPNFSGSTDSTSSAARFWSPSGIALDGAGNLFVAEVVNNIIRKVSATGAVTTLAGTPGGGQFSNGIGADARFALPHGVAVDRDGNIFVADTYNSIIRKITPDRVVTTFAGTPGRRGSTDGPSLVALFSEPFGLAIDGSGHLIVTDLNGTIRLVTPSGLVTTIAGAPGTTGNADGIGSSARFYSPTGVAVDASGTIYVADSGNHTIRRGVPTLALSSAPSSQHVATGDRATFTVAAAGGVLSYQWNKNGTAIAGATGATFAITSVTAADMGFYFVTVRGGTSSLDSPVAILTVAESSGYTFTTLAGTAGIAGTADGIGPAAQFNDPEGVTVDGAGNIFVSDAGNGAIRKITPTGIVTAFAGVAGVRGSTDGTGAEARFANCNSLAFDPSGNLFVADSDNYTLRRITPTGVVTTAVGKAGARLGSVVSDSGARFNFPYALAISRTGELFVTDSSYNVVWNVLSNGGVSTYAGLTAVRGSTDGSGSNARFFGPHGIAIDSAGVVYVADTLNHTIRKITEAPGGGRSGDVTTLAGAAGQAGNADGPIASARFSNPNGLAFDRSGNLFVADTGNHTIRKISPDGFVTTIAGGVGLPGSADGLAGTARFSGPTGLAIDDSGNIFVADTGNNTIRRGALARATAPNSRLSNLSTRGLVEAGGDLTVGFVVRGGGKSVLVRAVGPTLTAFGVAGPLADPKLDLISAGTNAATNSNDDWGGSAALVSAFANVGAFPLPVGSKEAALLATLPAAGYSARVQSSVAGGSGIALAEVYDRDANGAASRLVNVSALGFVGTGAQALAPGFVIDGTAPKRLLIRAVGPGLAAFGVGGALADPQLAVIPLGQTFTVAGSDNWDGSTATAAAFAQAGAFALAPGSKDAALTVRLPPGGYSVVVSGAAGTTGRALVEIYDLDP